MKALRQLNLSNTGITDTGLEAIAGLDELTSLFLGGTKVTNDGFQRLQKALPKCSIPWWPK